MISKYAPIFKIYILSFKIYFKNYKPCITIGPLENLYTTADNCAGLAIWHVDVIVEAHEEAFQLLVVERSGLVGVELLEYLVDPG